MDRLQFQIRCNSERDTRKIAQRLAPVLNEGDCLLLEGNIGAGKSFFARSLIQSVMGVVEDVPSPTFTLVQTYETKIGEIWHCDLYRLSDPQEVFELGLVDAFEAAVCLIEWPEKLLQITPKDALRISIKVTEDDQRILTFEGSDARWSKKLEVLKNATS